jgi:hypothetical protein
MEKKNTKKVQIDEEEEKYISPPHNPSSYLYLLYRGSAHDSADLDEETKREVQGKRVVIDKETGKAKEVDMYDRDDGSKKKNKDPEQMKARLASTLEQSIMPSNISK